MYKRPAETPLTLQMWIITLCPLLSKYFFEEHCSAHWNGKVVRFDEIFIIGFTESWGNVVILIKISSVAALEVIKMATSSAASDENVAKMMIFPF